MKQNTIKSTDGARKARKRVGRGGAHGTYSGRGMKGQKARTGGGVRVGFEGGQTPLLMRMPKLKGFTNPSKVDYFGLNVSLLDQRFEDGDTVDSKALVEKGILKRETPLKLLGMGELTKKLTITVNLASKGAIEKVEKAGGTLNLLGVISTKNPERTPRGKKKES